MDTQNRKRLIDTENKLMVARWERWFVFNGDRVSVWEDKKVLGMDGDNGCTTM